MTLRRFFSHATAPLIVLVAAALGLLSLAGGAVEVRNGYGAIAAAWFLFTVLGPGLAVAAAWDTSRFRDLLAHHRYQAGAWRIVARRVFPLAGVAFVVATATLIALGGAGNGQTTGGIVIVLLHSVLWPMTGAACGLWLPAVAAVVVSALVSAIVLLYPSGMTDMRWRQMFGQAYAGCCRIDQRMDPLLVHVSVAVLSVLLLACLILVALRGSTRVPGWAAVSTAAVLAIVGVGAGYWLSADGTATSTVARDPEALHCDADRCVWPESDPDTVEANLAALRGMGVSDIRVVDVARPDPLSAADDARPLGPDEVSLVTPDDPQDPEELRAGLLRQLMARDAELTETPSCLVNELGETWPVSEILFDLPVGVIEQAGLDAQGRFRGADIDRELLVDTAAKACDL